MPPRPNEARLTKALSHPVRMRVLAVLSSRVSSPSDLAKELEESLGVVSYHVRQLLELDCIELVETKPRRGALEHYYRATTRAIFDKDWDKLPKEARTSISSGTLSEIWRDVGRSLTSGDFDAEPERHLSWTTLHLDEKGWDAVNEKLASVFEFALSEHARAAGRRAEGDSARVSKLVLMHYLAAAADEAEKPVRRQPAKHPASAGRTG